MGYLSSFVVRLEEEEENEDKNDHVRVDEYDVTAVVLGLHVAPFFYKKR